MLKIKDITTAYDNETVLSHLSYDFEDGKKYAIVGPSGIGKTTLLNILCGLKKPDGGSVETSYTRPAYVFQDPRLFPWLTALENVTLVCADKQKAKDILTSLSLDDDTLSKYPHELSGGMRQRVAIARALCFDGDIVLMDEPFKGLDSEMRRYIREFIFHKLKNKTVIMITHQPEDAQSCDVILRINGSPVTELEAEESGNSKTE